MVEFDLIGNPVTLTDSDARLLLTAAEAGSGMSIGSRDLATRLKPLVDPAISGDPSIYSALAEQTRRLDEAGVNWDVTPGVPAYAAAAAIIGLRKPIAASGKATRL